MFNLLSLFKRNFPQNKVVDTVDKILLNAANNIFWMTPGTEGG